MIVTKTGGLFGMAALIYQLCVITGTCIESLYLTPQGFFFFFLKQNKVVQYII